MNQEINFQKSFNNHVRTLVAREDIIKIREKGGQVSGKRQGRNRRAQGSFQGETPGIFIVLSGFATSDLSVDFCDARQGGGAYGKTPATRPF